MTIGQKVISLYFLMTYFFPLVGNAIFSDEITSIYKIHEPSFLSVSLIVAVYAGYLYLARRGFHFAHRSLCLWISRPWNRAGVFYKRHRLIFAMFCFLVGFYFFQRNFSSYRYSHKGILERDSGVLLLGIFVSSAVIVDMIYSMFVDRGVVVKFSRRWFETVLLAIAQLLVVDGTGNMFIALFCLFYAFAPSYFQRLFFVDQKRDLRRWLSDVVPLAAISFLIFGVSWTYGESIKNSSKAQTEVVGSHAATVPEVAGPEIDDAVPYQILGFTVHISASRAAAARQRWEDRYLNWAERFKTLAMKMNHFVRTGEWLRTGGPARPPEVLPRSSSGGGLGLRARVEKYFEVVGSVDFTKFAYYLVERLSAHFYSYLHVYETPREELRDGPDSALVFPIRTFMYRVDGVMGGILGIQRPEITSLSQLNYRKLVKIPPRAREGTSPGLLGTFGYVFVFPLSLIACLVYLCFLSHVFDALVGRNDGKTIPVIGLFLIMTVFSVFFDSPFDFLQIVDNGAVKALLILGIFFGLQYRPSENTDEAT